MPVAPSQKEPSVIRYHLLSKSPTFHITPSSGSENNLYVAEASSVLIPEDRNQNLSDASMLDQQGQYISTHSPPILNLSPNLSPTEPQRTSPFYDLRESTRRRGQQGMVSLLLYAYVSNNIA